MHHPASSIELSGRFVETRRISSKAENYAGKPCHVLEFLWGQIHPAVADTTVLVAGLLPAETMLLGADGDPTELEHHVPTGSTI